MLKFTLENQYRNRPDVAEIGRFGDMGGFGTLGRFGDL